MELVENPVIQEATLVRKTFLPDSSWGVGRGWGGAGEGMGIFGEDRRNGREGEEGTIPSFVFFTPSSPEGALSLGGRRGDIPAAPARGQQPQASNDPGLCQQQRHWDEMG